MEPNMICWFNFVLVSKLCLEGLQFQGILACCRFADMVIYGTLDAPVHTNNENKHWSVLENVRLCLCELY